MLSNLVFCAKKRQGIFAPPFFDAEDKLLKIVNSHARREQESLACKRLSPPRRMRGFASK